MFHDQDVKMGCLAESVALLSNTLMKTFPRKLKSVSPLLLEHILSSPILKELPRFAVVSVPHYYAVQGRCVNQESPNKALHNFVKSHCPWSLWTPPGPEVFFPPGQPRLQLAWLATTLQPCWEFHKHRQDSFGLRQPLNYTMRKRTWPTSTQHPQTPSESGWSSYAKTG